MQIFDEKNKTKRRIILLQLTFLHSCATRSFYETFGVGVGGGGGGGGGGGSVLLVCLFLLFSLFCLFCFCFCFFSLLFGLFCFVLFCVSCSYFLPVKQMTTKSVGSISVQNPFDFESYSVIQYTEYVEMC